MAVARLAVEARIGGNEDAFDERAVTQFPEKFLRAVARALGADQFERLERVMFLELLAQRFGQVAHRVPRGRARYVEPMQQLIHPIGGLAPGGELLGQLFTGERFDVGHYFGT